MPRDWIMESSFFALVMRHDVVFGKALDTYGLGMVLGSDGVADVYIMRDAAMPRGASLDIRVRHAS